jgi:hypothetical protein
VPEENHAVLLSVEFFSLCCAIESAGLLACTTHDKRFNEVWALLNFWYRNSHILFFVKQWGLLFQMAAVILVMLLAALLFIMAAAWL